jgi:Flp pilus assembly protein TadD
MAHPRRTQLLPLVVLLAATVWCYVPAGNLSFLFYDDEAYVTSNSHVRSGLTAANAAWAFTSLEAANWHPLTWLSHMVDCQLFGVDPADHHYVSVLFHFLNVLLLFLLLVRATGYVWRSFYVSALFALHPINVQSVAWVAERKNLLSTFFLLIAIWGYGWYVKNPNWKRYLAMAGAFAASLMSKPMGVTFPFILLLLDYWPLCRLQDPSEFRRSAQENVPTGWWGQLARLALEKLPLAVMAAASSWITLVAQRRGGATHPEAPLALSLRLGNAIYSYSEYVRMMFWPSRLGVFYPYPVLSFRAIASSALLVAAVTVLVVAMRQRKYLFFGWFFFPGTLVPVIGLIQVGKQAMADRYAYIPLIGLFVIVVWLAAEAIVALRVPRVLTIAIATCLLLAAGVATRINLRYWQNSITVFTRAREVASRPDSMIEVNLGESLFSAGFSDEGLQHYLLAENLDPRNAVVHYDIAVALMRKEQLPQAAEEFQAALRYTTKNGVVTVSSLNNLGLIYMRLGNLEEAWKFFSAALKVEPNHYPAMLGRGVILYRQARYPEAADEISRSIQIHPSPDAWSLLGRVLEAQGKSAQAAAAYQQGMQLRQ